MLRLAAGAGAGTGGGRDARGTGALGARARETVERQLTWDRYVGRVEELLVEAARA